MLQLQNIRKAYTTGDFTQVALKDVSIAFRDSEFVAILGQSGSGKTTMLNIIGGLDHYDSGDLQIDGISTKRYTDRDWDTYRNNRIGFVFQSYNLIPHQTVLANVELALTLSGVSAEERRERALQALDQVGLAEHVNKKPSQLSGGQMQRVAIARALINNPEILLADEPTGALDSKTSVQIMDLLTQIAADRLVIMVTHNPELAEEYANRIVNLSDGEILSDTNPFEPTEGELRAAKPAGKHTSMSFRTALGLSFNNLMTKKGRTIMTALAGSIGIIGIAAILALANGVNNYIEKTEEETLSQYPLQIMSSGFDMTSMVTNETGGTQDADDPDGQDAKEAEPATTLPKDEQQGGVKISRMMTTMFNSIGSNDLASLKEFLDGGSSGVEPYVNAIEYTYSVTPQIFLSDTSKGIKQVNPDTGLSAFGMGAGGGNSVMSSMYSSNQFFQMPTETSLYESQYEVMAGTWPQNYNECVLVTTQSGRITDYALYSLGLRDNAELKEMVRAFLSEEEYKVKLDKTFYSYDELLGITFKVVNGADLYQYDGTYGVWKDKSDDAAFMRNLVANGEDLKIVGIVKPAEGQKIAMLQVGVNYPSSLTQHLIAEASEKQIVKDQLARPLIDVITGRSFEAEGNDRGGDFNMQNLFSIDESAIAKAFKVDESAVKLDPAAIADAIDPALFPAFSQPTAEEIALLGITPSNTTITGITGAALAALMQYLQTSGVPAIDDPAFASSFMNWVNTCTDTFTFSGSISSEPVTPHDFLSQTIAALVMMDQATPAESSPIAKFLATYLMRAVSEYTAGLTATVAAQVGGAVAQQMGTALGSAMSVDQAAFASAFKVNMSGGDLTEIIGSMSTSKERSYDANLLAFSYADLAKPAQISLYPKDFESKDRIKEILDDYNARMKENGYDDRVINYTDIVGALMSSVTTIVDMISTVLIAFVAISLIVSSIMIGVITYISVLERIKEIGILRAIGASKRDISRIFNAETVIEGLIAGVLGVVVTALLCIPANIIVENWRDVSNIAVLPVGAALVLVVISIALCFIAGVIPSRSASKKDPVEALRSE